MTLKLLLALCMTVISSIVFVWAGQVYWIEALVMCNRPAMKLCGANT